MNAGPYEWQKRSWASLEQELELQAIVSCQVVGVGNWTLVPDKSSVHSNYGTIFMALWRCHHFVQPIRALLIVRSFNNSLQIYENSGNSISYCSPGILFQPQVAASQYTKKLLRTSFPADLQRESLNAVPFPLVLQILVCLVSWSSNLYFLNSDKLLINTGSVATGHPVAASTRWWQWSW